MSAFVASSTRMLPPSDSASRKASEPITYTDAAGTPDSWWEAATADVMIRSGETLTFSADNSSDHACGVLVALLVTRTNGRS